MYAQNFCLEPLSERRGGFPDFAFHHLPGPEWASANHRRVRRGFANLGLSKTSRPWGMTALKTLLAKWAPGVCKTSVDQPG